MALTNIQQAAVAKAVAFLNAAKVSFVIIDPATMDFINASDDMRNAKLQKPAKRVIVNDFVQLGYIDSLKNLKDGQTYVVRWKDHMAVIPDAKAWHNFKASVNSAARRLWTADGYVYVHDMDHIEILRVGS